ncbi:MAG: HAD-IA family hydrolase [Thermoplasmata archaeon]
MPLKAIFLDLGGTLLDLESDRRAHLEMMRAFREDMGLPTSPEELLNRYETLREERIRRLETRWQQDRDISRGVVTSILREEGLSMTRAHWDRFLAAYWHEHRRWLHLYPGARKALSALHRPGIHIGLISDVDEDFLQLCLYKFPLEDHLDSITTSEETGVAKPHEDIFMRALSKAECEPQEAIHVGDSLDRDVLGARKVGMRSILIGSQGTDQSADYVVPDITAACQVLERLAEEEDH